MNTRPSHLVKSVIVGGPWCPWPQDCWDGTCVWPGVHSKPPEWWDEFWKLAKEAGQPTPSHIFLEGYSPRQPWMKP
jgi:hypothetical protein